MKILIFREKKIKSFNKLIPKFCRKTWEISIIFLLISTIKPGKKNFIVKVWPTGIPTHQNTQKTDFGLMLYTK